MPAGAERGRSAVRRAAYVASLALAVLCLPGGHARADDDDAPPAKLADRPVSPATPAVAGASAKSGAPVVELNTADQAKGGVATAALKATPFRSVVRAYGVVLATDKLTSLYNATLAQTAQLHVAEARAAASQRALERARELLKAFSNAKAQEEAAAATARLDALEVETARAQMIALRNTAVQDWGPVLGPAILDHTALVEDILARRRVLVQIALPPGEAVAPGRRLKLLLADGSQQDAELISEASQADLKMQGRTYYVAAPASGGLMPGLSVEAELARTGETAGVGIPSSAVVWQGGKPWVYLRTAPTRFERRPLAGNAAPTDEGGYVVPAASVPARDGLVVAGAQILLSEESRAQIPSDEDDN